ncbi:NAD-dependent epimerase/dehydratase family protein [Catenuloplanes sp. NPDC051500]|uniref:NAD-dependent epimerase/dehydratase family protein n=1 Tax=Catenuloplanes sp. NPDC051500 TaxID=3363959 RepID=UPI00379ECCCA
MIRISNANGGIAVLIGVTGGGGKIGQRVVADLTRHGHKCRSIDVGMVYETPDRYRRADLRELWQTLDALDGLDAVVHLGALGAPDPATTSHGFLAEQNTFATNTVATYNVFTAARSLGIDHVVWASSETVAGFPFQVAPPDFLPVTEEHSIRPEYSYALSKSVGEHLAQNVAYQHGLSITSLRFSVVFDAGRYELLPDYWADPQLGRWNLWSYVDIDDVATSCRLAIEATPRGAESFVVAAPDTLMKQPTEELIQRFAPELAPLVREPLPGFRSLQSTDRFAEVFGFRPERSWRDRPTG